MAVGRYTGAIFLVLVHLTTEIASQGNTTATTTAASARNDDGSGDAFQEVLVNSSAGATTSQAHTLYVTTTLANNSTSQANSTNATLTTPPLTTTTPTTIRATTAPAEAASCRDSANAFRGDSFIISCPAGCSSESISVWGTGIYTSDSRVCQAAIHDGRITDRGGRVTVYQWSGQPSYQGSTQNGIQSDSYGDWSSSFAFRPETTTTLPVTTTAAPITTTTLPTKRPEGCHGKTHFECDNGECINIKYLCDGNDECGDWSDEVNCTTTTTQGHTIPVTTTLANNTTSQANSTNATLTTPPLTTTTPTTVQTTTAPAECPKGLFRCDTGRCISTNWQCDGDDDCGGDGSDEADCDLTSSPTPYTDVPSSWTTAAGGKV